MQGLSEQQLLLLLITLGGLIVLGRAAGTLARRVQPVTAGGHASLWATRSRRSSRSATRRPWCSSLVADLSSPMARRLVDVSPASAVALLQPQDKTGDRGGARVVSASGLRAAGPLEPRVVPRVIRSRTARSMAPGGRDHRRRRVGAGAVLGTAVAGAGSTWERADWPDRDGERGRR